MESPKKNMVTKLVTGLLMILAGSLIVFGGILALNKEAPAPPTDGAIFPPKEEPEPPPAPVVEVNSYQECVDAGYGIIKTLPPKCETPDGRIFVEPDPCLLILCPQDKPLCKDSVCHTIDSFEDCAAMGYPVMESYPEQCRTPDGQTFVRNISSGCQADSECTAGYYCKLGLCTEFNPDISCEENADCMIINNNRRFSCCYAGACDVINHTQTKWVSVNANWYTSERAEVCPSEDACGAAPTCTADEEKIFDAVCINHMCAKQPAEND